MDKVDENLYRYILDNSQVGSIYSADSNEEIEKLLREQNTLTIRDLFIGFESEFPF